MIFPVSYWVWIGSLQLIYMSWKDLRNNMMVDDRHNWFMMGLSVSLISHVNVKITYLVVLVISVIIIMFVFKISKTLGSADVKSLMWISYGFGLMNPTFLLWFFVWLAGLILIYFGVKTLYLKIPKEKPTPFFMVILFAFMINAVVFGLYIR